MASLNPANVGKGKTPWRSIVTKLTTQIKWEDEEALGVWESNTIEAVNWRKKAEEYVLGRQFILTSSGRWARQQHT